EKESRDAALVNGEVSSRTPIFSPARRIAANESEYEGSALVKTSPSGAAGTPGSAAVSSTNNNGFVSTPAYSGKLFLPGSVARLPEPDYSPPFAAPSTTTSPVKQQRFRPSLSTTNESTGELQQRTGRASQDTSK
ncbi:unnamed protein product, partial [Amoebophrya sp. A25]